MPDNDNVAYGSIIIGIIIIIYPYLGQETLSKISGLMLLGLFFLIFFSEFKQNSLNDIGYNTRNKNYYGLLLQYLRYYLEFL